MQKEGDELQVEGNRSGVRMINRLEQWSPWEVMEYELR